MRSVVLLVALLLAGCSSGPDGGGAAPAPSSSAPSSPALSSPAPSSPAPSSSAQPGEDELLVELDRGDGSEPERYTLSCTDPVAGDLPDAAAACAHLRGMTDPFARLPSDLICTEQFGGPQTARVTGRWAGEDVDLRLSRVNGCRISQWDGLGPVLPGPVG